MLFLRGFALCDELRAVLRAAAKLMNTAMKGPDNLESLSPAVIIKWC